MLKEPGKIVDFISNFAWFLFQASLWLVLIPIASVEYLRLTTKTKQQ